MFTSLLKRRPMRESGFTMIELLVAVVIIAILAAISVPVYLNLRDGAVKSALKSDVNATVKAASIALTQGTDISVITANGGAAYVPANPAKGEVITITQATAPVTGAAFVQDRDNSSDGYVIKSATYAGTASGVAAAKAVIATADNQYFIVAGSLSKAAGAPVDYNYGFSSVEGKYTQGDASGSTPTASPSNSASASPSPSASASPSTPAQAPAFTSATTATTGLAGDTYPGFTVTATGSPTPTFTSSDIKSLTGLTLDANGTIHGTVSNSASGDVLVSIVASNSVSGPTQYLTIPIQAAPAITNPTAVLPAAAQYTPYDSNAPVVTASGFPTPSFAAPVATGTSTTGLPIGLSMDSTGKINGTPASTDVTGDYTVVVTASNGVGAVATKSFTLNLGPATPILNQSGAGVTGWAYPVGSTSVLTPGSAGLLMQAGPYSYSLAYYTVTGLTVGKKYTLSLVYTISATQVPYEKNLYAGYGSATSTAITDYGIISTGAAGDYPVAKTFTATTSTMRVFAETAFTQVKAAAGSTLKSVTLTPAG